MMTICTTPHSTLQEDPDKWIGGEAAVGTQAERHVRSQEKKIRGLAEIIVGLAFIGGFAMGGALCRLAWKPGSRPA